MTTRTATGRATRAKAGTSTRPKTTVRTAKDEKSREAALQQGATINIGGKKHTVVVGDLTSHDVAMLRREVGLSFFGLLNALNKDPDIDLVAAIVWLARRVKGEPDLEYREVAEALDYASDYRTTVKNAEPDDAEGGDGGN